MSQTGFDRTCGSLDDVGELLEAAGAGAGELKSRFNRFSDSAELEVAAVLGTTSVAGVSKKLTSAALGSQ